MVKHGKAVAHRFADSCIRSERRRRRPIGATSARSTPTGRPISISPTSCRPSISTTATWPIWTYVEITAPAKFVHNKDGRRGMAVSSLVSGGCIVSGASVRRSLLFTGVRVNSYSACEEAVILPYVEVGRSARLSKVVIDRGVRIPEGLVVGEDPELDAQRFRRTESGICLITQPMIDRLGIARAMRVLSVASEVFPLIKTGGLADVAGALPGALAAHGVAMRTMLPGYPRRARGARRGQAC